MGSYNVSLQNLSEIGLGRSLDYQFLAPLFFVVAHTLFFRKSIIYFAIIFYSGALFLNVYEILTEKSNFFSDSENCFEFGNEYAGLTPLIIIPEIS